MSMQGEVSVERGAGEGLRAPQRLEQHGTFGDDYAVQIEGGKPELVGSDPEHPGLLEIQMPLEPVADISWCRIFNEIPPGRVHLLNPHPPEAGSTAIAGKVPDRFLEDYVAEIRERIAAANDQYNETIAPALKAAADEREREREREERRLEEARAKLEQL
jgi:hypothetical protein